MAPTDLTDPRYWSERQRDWYQAHGLINDPTTGGWPQVPEMLRHLDSELGGLEGARFLELGCVPGNVSAALALKYGYRPEGLDFSPEAELYLETMRSAGVAGAVLHRGDLRDFRPPDRYDIVASFGLIEHFTDFETIMDHHDRLLRPGGLCLISVPHFRWVQWGYHFLFDRPDLRRHNLRAMRLEPFSRFAARHGHTILSLGYVGKLVFFNVNLEGSSLVVWPRRLASRLVRELGQRLGTVLPNNSRFIAPFVVYLGRKRAGPSE